MSRPVIRCTAYEIRCLFNYGRYFERFQEGWYFGYIEWCGDRGDGSQIVRYVMAHDHGKTVAVVHQMGDQYGMPFGDDRPDPKRLVHEGVEYRYSKDAVPSLELPPCPDTFG